MKYTNHHQICTTKFWPLVQKLLHKEEKTFLEEQIFLLHTKITSAITEFSVSRVHTPASLRINVS